MTSGSDSHPPLVLLKQKSQPPWTPMNTASETTSLVTGATLFFALNKRLSPIAHLRTLRGHQDEPFLHTDDFMSPSLHNSSDAYQRLLRAQVFYADEIVNGLRETQCLMKSSIDFVYQLQTQACIFLHGYNKQCDKDNEERALQDWRRHDYLEREFDGMMRRGWTPADLGHIHRAIVCEEKLNEPEMDMDRSFDSIDTVVSSIFDTIEEEDDQGTNDDDEYDHLYCFNDGIPPSDRAENEETAINTLKNKGLPNVEDGGSQTEESCTHAADDEEFDSTSFISDEKVIGYHQRSPSIQQPSALLRSPFHQPDKYSDIEDEKDTQDDWDKVFQQSPSPPASLYLDSSAIPDYDSNHGNKKLSPARGRKSDFLADLISVRQQILLDIEAEKELRANEEKEYERNRWKREAERYFPICLVSLRLRMFADNVIGVNLTANKLFRSRNQVGYHETEFKGRFRQALRDNSKNGLAALVDRAFWKVLNDKKWEQIVDNGYSRSFALARSKASLVVQARDNKTIRKDLWEATSLGVQHQNIVEADARRVIQEALWADEQVFNFEIAEGDEDED